jgi:hypothetical protein
MTAPHAVSAPPQHAPGTVQVGFGDGGAAQWSGMSEADIDRVCAFVETIKPADTVT